MKLLTQNTWHHHEHHEQNVVLLLDVTKDDIRNLALNNRHLHLLDLHMLRKRHCMFTREFSSNVSSMVLWAAKRFFCIFHENFMLISWKMNSRWTISSKRKMLQRLHSRSFMSIPREKFSKQTRSNQDNNDHRSSMNRFNLQTYSREISFVFNCTASHKK